MEGKRRLISSASLVLAFSRARDKHKHMCFTDLMQKRFTFMNTLVPSIFFAIDRRQGKRIRQTYKTPYKDEFL